MEGKITLSHNFLIETCAGREGLPKARVRIYLDLRKPGTFVSSSKELTMGDVSNSVDSKSISMAVSIESVREEAQKQFLGKGSVIGVGITGDDEHGLLFLLRENSQAAKTQILSWASNLHVTVSFRVAKPRPY